MSLFDGISCGQIAFERAGIKVNNYYAFEIEKNAIAITQYNYPNTIQCGDVFETDFTEFIDKNIDILIGGSPCQFWFAAKCHTAKNKKEAIEHLAGKLKDAGYIADVDSYIEDIYLRESQGQTGIGHYVAIPHGKSDSVTQVGIAIGKVQDEIEWETLDGNGVKLIFLFAVGNDNENAKTHLRLLAEVARTLGNDDAVEALLNASTVEDLKAVFA